MVYLTFEYNNISTHKPEVRTKYENAKDAAILAYGEGLICDVILKDTSVIISMVGDRESNLEKAIRSFLSIAGRRRPYMANTNGWIMMERAMIKKYVYGKTPKFI